jgi:1,4-dihydroxy-2-naphthoate octaprenyltransferase
MKLKNTIKIWFQQIRGPFLILSVFLVLLGIAAAYHDSYIHWVHGVLLIIGVVLAHISVNLFNELSDYQTKIDEHTVPTPFSGGSGMLQSGKTSPKAVRITAYSTLVAAGVIGTYFFIVSGWLILIFMLAGGLGIRYYTSHFAKWLIGEFVAGLTLGTLVVLGVYYCLATQLTLDVILISIPPGILTFLLLFLNEFPDTEADRKGGRHHLIIHFGKNRSAKIYLVGLGIVYLMILVTPFVSHVPHTVLISLITLPLALKAGYIVLRQYDDTPKLIPALGMNVMVVILTDLFLAIGYFL